MIHFWVISMKKLKALEGKARNFYWRYFVLKGLFASGTSLVVQKYLRIRIFELDLIFLIQISSKILHNNKYQFLFQGQPIFSQNFIKSVIGLRDFCEFQLFPLFGLFVLYCIFLRDTRAQGLPIWTSSDRAFMSADLLMSRLKKSWQLTLIRKHIFFSITQFYFLF